MKYHDSTNVFGDEFYVLYSEVPIEEYVEFEEFIQNKNMQGLWQQIVDAFWDMKKNIRFIATGISENEQAIIPSLVVLLHLHGMLRE